MNILFFLSPKQDLMYVYDDFTLRQTLEKWENNRYASIPVLNRRGEYVGTLTEGDILWGLKQQHGLDIEAAEDVPISSFAHKRDYKAVTVTTSMDQLIEAAMNQNFVPVVDDRGIFIGIVRRQAIIRYCYDKARTEARKAQSAPDACPKGSLAAGGGTGSPSQSKPDGFASSPEGGAKTSQRAAEAEGRATLASPFGRGGIAQAMTERVRMLPSSRRLHGIASGQLLLCTPSQSKPCGFASSPEGGALGIAQGFFSLY